MAAPWRGILLVCGLIGAGCRTPQKAVYVWPDAEEVASDRAGGRHAGASLEPAQSAAAETKSTTPVFLPTAPTAETAAVVTEIAETQTDERPAEEASIPANSREDANEISPADSELKPEHPAQSLPTSSPASIHLPPAHQAALETRQAAVAPQLALPTASLHSNSPCPVIHLSLPAGRGGDHAAPPGGPALPTVAAATPETRPLAGKLDVPAGRAAKPFTAGQQAQPVELPASGDGPLAVAADQARPIGVEPILNGTADEAEWRQWQLARQRAAEKTRLAERENLTQTLERFLQAGAQ